MYIDARRVFNHPKFFRLARGGEKPAGFVPKTISSSGLNTRKGG